MKRRAKAAAKKTRRRRAAAAGASSNHFRVVISAAEIQRGVRRLAREIDRDYQGKTLHVVGVLENCFLFMADLVRQLKTPLVCHFVRAEIREETSPGGAPLMAIHYIPRFEAEGKDVLLVDGVLQSGMTLDHLVRSIEGAGATSVRTATLVERSDELKTDARRDYVAFKVTGKALLGYGLAGDGGRCRNLTYLAERA